MPSIDEVARQISTAGVPVLFLDTCILLDIIRSPSRCLPDYAARASELLKLASDRPPACLMVVSSIVPDEWNANAEKVTGEIVQHFQRMEEHSLHFHSACQALGIAVPFGQAHYTQWGVAERLRDHSKQLLDRAICLDEDAESWGKALSRLRKETPPSRKSAGWQDCFILEQYLAVCRRVQAAGFARKRLFCTSNTNDYCEAGKGVHPVLASEFAASGLIFTANLPWVVHEITH